MGYLFDSDMVAYFYKSHMQTIILLDSALVISVRIILHFIMRIGSTGMFMCG